MTTNDTELIPLLTAISGALGVIAIGVRKLVSHEEKRLRTDLKRERAEHARLQKALDESASRVEDLLTKLREVQSQMAKQAIADMEESQKQLGHMQEVIRDLQAGRIKNGEANAALQEQLRKVQEAFRKGQIRVSFLAAENKDLCEKLLNSGFQGDRDLTLEDLREILDRCVEEENGRNTHALAE